MTYRVVQDNKGYRIVEKDSELTVMEKSDEKSARELCRSLNLGSGFDGFTPPFFTLEFKQKERPSRV